MAYGNDDILPRTLSTVSLAWQLSRDTGAEDGWAYWATYSDGHQESGPLDTTDQDVAEAQWEVGTMFPELDGAAWVRDPDDTYTASV